MLPTLLMAREEKDGDEVFIIAGKTLEDMLEGAGAKAHEVITVGVYKLVSKRRVSLVPYVEKELKVRS